MRNELFSLYDGVIDSLSGDERVSSVRFGARWALAETERAAGLGMFTAGHSIAPLFSAGLAGLPVRTAGEAIKSWNLEEASAAVAAVNAALNTPERAAALGCGSGHYADGVDFTGKTVGIIGHMNGPAGMREAAKQVCVLERAPQEGDWPDAACDWILPDCDIVLITGSSLINKTLPHLLSLCRDAFTILTGPSVPLCPALLDCGLDRISGLIVQDREGLRRRVTEGQHGSPYVHGQPFVLSRR